MNTNVGKGKRAPYLTLGSRFGAGSAAHSDVGIAHFVRGSVGNARDGRLTRIDAMS